MKNLIKLAILSTLLLSLFGCNEAATQSNTTTLLYSHADDTGYYFTAPDLDNSIVYVDPDEIKIDASTLYEGKKFTGSFYDPELWELKSIEEN